MGEQEQIRQELSVEVAPVVAQGGALVIETQDQYVAAADFLRTEVLARRTKIGERLDPLIKSAHRAHKDLLQLKKDCEEPLLRMETALRARMIAFETEQERIRRQKEAELQAEARRQEEERRIAEAAAYEAVGDHDTAEAVIAEPIIDVPVTVAPAVPKVHGISYQTTYSAEVINLMALVKAVAAGQAPIHALQANMVYLNAQARAAKGQFALPGVRCTGSRGLRAGR